MKKIFVFLFMLLFLFSMTACSKSNKSNDSNNYNAISEEEKISNSLNNIYVHINQDVLVDASLFKDAYYKIGNGLGDKFLFIKSDGTMFEFSNKKFSSNDSHIKLFNSKLKSSVIMGFANFERMADNLKDGEYWFLLEDYSIVRFDSNNDTVSYVNSFVNDGWGRENSTSHIILKIKNNIKYDRIISWADNMRSFIIAYNNNLTIYESTGPTGEEVLNVSETRDIEDYSSLIIYSKDFIKIDDDYYNYVQINKEETSNYVDAKPKFSYQKVSLDDLKDLITYWDGTLLVSNSGKVYTTNIMN